MMLLQGYCNRRFVLGRFHREKLTCVVVWIRISPFILSADEDRFVQPCELLRKSVEQRTTQKSELRTQTSLFITICFIDRSSFFLPKKWGVFNRHWEIWIFKNSRPNENDRINNSKIIGVSGHWRRLTHTFNAVHYVQAYDTLTALSQRYWETEYVVPAWIIDNETLLLQSHPAMVSPIGDCLADDAHSLCRS